MKRWILLSMLLVAVVGLLTACGGAEANVRRTIEKAAASIEDGLNQGDLAQVQTFFATEAEGANPEGLTHTWQALQTFAQGLTNSTRVQVHSFEVQEVALHEQGNLARATYRLHLSVLRDGQVVFGFVATQNLALMRTGGQWLISGGDQAQLSEVVGQWPLPDAQSSN
jgi:ketosteroid isomerase-like protein